ncbi:MAG TPA: FHA domain-containing protein, partial [Kofleriaceae bacterium]
MSLARLVVIEGPDAGREFEIPMRGGVVGRGDGSLVQLTDPTVSRQHGLLELRDGQLCWVDDKTRTLVNGKPVAHHVLGVNDEIVIGATRLVYLPVEGVALTRASAHVTMEVGSRQLLALTGDPSDQRARRHLAALAQLGDRLRAESAAGRDAVARAAGDAALTTLGAHRAFVLSASPGSRRVTPVAA